MVNTPAEAPPRYPGPLTTPNTDAAHRDLVDLLREALQPAFVLIRKLGEGGMGAVYLARDPALKRLVAVKVLLPEHAANPELRARFQREAEAVAAISHPNVVAVHSVGTLANGVPYIVMQYVEGPSMAERLREEGPLDLETAKQVLGQVASALDAAHRRGIVHRDIKAANILWDEQAGRALVGDFGIAAVLEREHEEESSRLTQTGMVVGTPRYMSPEQLLSEPVTERSDIYSFGLLGYELLTGEGPYQVSSPNQLVAAHLRDMPRPVSLMRPDVDPVLESILASCLEKDAHGRPSAEDVARRLQHGASILLEWPPPGLEDLHGAIARPLARLLAGSFLITVPLILVSTAPVDSGLRPGWPMIMVLPVLAGIGGILVLSSGHEAWRLFRVAVRAARAGYGWGIIAEVLVDTAKDTGALITGDREYAALDPERRSVIRVWRVRRAGFQVAAGLWALSGFLIGLPFAVRLGAGPAALASWTLGVPLALLTAAGVLSRRESRLLDPIRSRLRRHRSPIERLSHLAQTWRDAFDRVKPTLGRGQGAVGRVTRRIVGIAAIAAVAFAGLTSATGLVALSVGAEASQSLGAFNVPSIQEKVARVRRLRSLRPAIDRSISPADAGRALRTLAFSGGRKPSALEAPFASPLPEISLPPGDPFKGGFFNGNAIRQARAGFSPEQRAYLQRVAALPGERELALAARAEIADWVGVSLVNPLPKRMSVLELPMPRFAPVKAAAYANAARAALAVEKGDFAGAERYLRDDIGVGFMLMEGPTIIENLIGVVIAQIGRAEMVPLYEMTGRAAEARAISAESDPVRDDVLPTLTMARMTPRERLAYVEGIVRDPNATRGLRWEMTEFQLAFQPCNQLGEILFGPGEAHQRRMAEARRVLVRTPGEDQLMTIAERALESPTSPTAIGMPVSITYRLMNRFARGVDAVTGSRRMQSCAFMRPF